MKKLTFIIVLLLIIGCTTVPTFTSHGILNLRVVDASNVIYRGGQPDANGFEYLKSIGVTNIIKLNLEDNEDATAKAIGLNVIYIPIDTDDQLFHLPQGLVEKAVTSITHGTYIHCIHGQDRTGLVIAGYKISNGMSKKDAEKEMLSNGFHKSLFGLWEYFKNHM